MNSKELAQIIAEYIGKHNETDNLGDNESIIMVGKCPTINLAELAELILQKMETTT